MPALISRFGVLRPLRERDFGLLWAGMAVSLLGDGFYNVALAWQVYQISNVPTALGIVGAAFTFSRLIALVAGGLLSDRYDRRWLLLAGNLVSCAAIGWLGVLSLAGSLRLWQVDLLVVGYGVGSAIFLPAFGAIVPQLLPPELLPNANALDQFVRQASLRLAGPALAGIIIESAGSGWALLGDAASFALAALTVLFMRPTGRPQGGGASGLRDLLAGLRYVLATPWLWATMFIAGAVSTTVIFGPAQVLLPYVVKNRLGGSASDLGLVLAVGGIGAVLASGFMGQRPLPRRCITAMYVGWAVWALPVVLFGLATRLWVLALAAFIYSAGLSVGQIIWNTLLHTRVPAGMLGRVAALDFQISLGLVPLSYAFVGPLAAAVGVTATLVGLGLLGTVTVLVPLALPGVRDLEKG